MSRCLGAGRWPNPFGGVSGYRDHTPVVVDAQAATVAVLEGHTDYVTGALGAGRWPNPYLVGGYNLARWDYVANAWPCSKVIPVRSLVRLRWPMAESFPGRGRGRLRPHLAAVGRATRPMPGCVRSDIPIRSWVRWRWPMGEFFPGRRTDPAAGDAQRGQCLTVLKVIPFGVRGALALADGRILSGRGATTHCGCGTRNAANAWPCSKDIPRGSTVCWRWPMAEFFPGRMIKPCD